MKILPQIEENPHQDQEINDALPNFLIDWINERDKAQKGEDTTSKSDESKMMFSIPICKMSQTPIPTL